MPKQYDEDYRWHDRRLNRVLDLITPWLIVVIALGVMLAWSL